MPTPEHRRRAVRAAVDIAAAHGVRSAAPVVLADGSNLLVHLSPTPVVARIATTTTLLRARPADWLARDLAVAGHLCGQGAPVVPPSGELPPGPHRRDGFTVSFWRHQPPSHVAPPSARTVGRMLAELHAALRGYPGELPLLGAPLADIASFLADADRFTAVAEGDVAAVRLAFERSRAAVLAAPGERQALHGDAHPGNLLAVGPGWAWTDFEDTCQGPLGWDLACLAVTSRLDGVAAVACHGHPIGGAELAPFVDLRELHRTVWLVAFAERFPARLPEARARLARLRDAERAG